MVLGNRCVMSLSGSGGHRKDIRWPRSATRWPNLAAAGLDVTYIRSVEANTGLLSHESRSPNEKNGKRNCLRRQRPVTLIVGLANPCASWVRRWGFSWPGRCCPMFRRLGEWRGRRTPDTKTLRQLQHAVTVKTEGVVSGQ